jgi:hypothetical protein
VEVVAQVALEVATAVEHVFESARGSETPTLEVVSDMAQVALRPVPGEQLLLPDPFMEDIAT